MIGTGGVDEVNRHRRLPVPAALAGWPGVILLATAVLGAWLAVHFGALDSASLDHGWLVDLLIAASVVGLCCGVLGHTNRWWRTWGIAVAVLAAGGVGAAAWWLKASSLVVEHYPPSFLFWAWAGLWGLGVALVGWRAGGVALRSVRIVSAPLILFTAFCLIQSHYGYWPTVGTLLQRPAPGQVSATVFTNRLHDPSPPPPVTTEAVRTQVGRYGPVTLPPAAGFAPGQAWMWLPPDYARVPHANLPVMLMLTGTPGDAQDWARAGQSITVANRWAQTHDGQGPVMLFLNENGGGNRDTECVNGPQGQAETYLTTTLPEYVHDTLGIDADPERWAVVGFSEGGTCALGLGLEDPSVYGRFVDLAGDLAPNFGHEQPPRVTLTRLYGGNATAETDHEPLHLLSTNRYQGSEGWLSAGKGDKQHAAIVSTLAAPARAAGVDVHASIPPGGHDWKYASRVLAHLYPTLVGSLHPPAGPDPIQG